MQVRGQSFSFCFMIKIGTEELGLFDASVASLTKKEYGSAVHFFIDNSKVFSTNIW